MTTSISYLFMLMHNGREAHRDTSLWYRPRAETQINANVQAAPYQVCYKVILSLP